MCNLLVQGNLFVFKKEIIGIKTFLINQKFELEKLIC